MPVVSSVKPLEADIPLPLSFEKFSHELEQLRLAYFDREIGSLLEATRRNFVLIGEGAADVCNLLNGESCECRARTGVSGVLVVDDVRANELMRQVNTGKYVLKVAGAVVLRIQEAVTLRRGDMIYQAIPSSTSGWRSKDRLVRIFLWRKQRKRRLGRQRIRIASISIFATALGT